MDLLQQLQIQRDIEALIRTFARLNDSNSYQQLVELFIDDAEYARPSAPNDIICGRQEILNSFTSRAILKTRHIVANIHVDIRSHEKAVAESQIILFIANQNNANEFNKIVVGGFYDELILQQGKWYFSKRQGYVDFAQSI